MSNAMLTNKKAKMAVLAVVVFLAFSDALSFCFYPKKEAGLCAVRGWVGVASPRCGGLSSPSLPIQNLQGQGESSILEKLGGDLPRLSAGLFDHLRFLHIQPRQEAGDLAHPFLVTQP